MKIHRLKLTNFAGVAERALCFEPSGVTVVEGPNEVGKTSLIQAIDLIFRYPDSSQATPVLAVKPVDRDVGAEVEVEFTTGPYHLVYRKRWHRSPVTELTVLAPHRQQFTGRSAHDRVDAILDETMDRELWSALRVQQGESITQADLAGTRLMAALDAAAAGALGEKDENDLFERARQEHERYFTAGGRPRGEWQQVQEELASAQREAQHLEQAFKALEEDTRHVERLQTRRAELEQHQKQLVPRIEELEASWEALESRRREVELEAARLAAAEERVRRAERDQKERLDLVREVREREGRLVELEAAVSRAREALAAAQAAHRAALDRARGLTERLVAQQARLQRAQADLERHRDRRDLEALKLTRERIRVVQAELRDADARVQASRVTDEDLAELERLHEAALTLSGSLAGSAPVVEVEALAAVDLTLGGVALRLAPGESVHRSVTDALELVLPDRLRVRVSAPLDVTELALRAAAAHDSEARRCQALGVADIQAARAEAEARRDAQRRLARARADLTPLLEGLTLEALEDRIERLSRQLHEQDLERPAHETPPPTLELAQAARQTAQTDLEAVEGESRALEAVVAECSQAHREAAEGAARAEAQALGAHEDVERAGSALAGARAQRPDEELERLAAEARLEAARMGQGLEAARAALEAQNPEQTRLLLENARAAQERGQKELYQLDMELATLRERLRIQGEAGLFDQLAQARSALEEVEHRHAALERRAQAARRLYATLGRHRDAARQRYVRPFQERVEQLGRMVYGPDFAVELDENLAIVRRHLSGRTVPYASLSTGAREQLSLLARLACAGMIGGEAGVPVILDDALGNTDPSRLERMGAVLNHAGEQGQIIILTCVPDRYQWVGRARVVRLEAGPPAADEVAAGVEATAPADRMLDVLRAQGRPLTKEELLALSGLGPALGTRLVDALVADGRIVRTGRARGTRYAPGP